MGTAFDTMESFIQALEEDGKLARVTAEVDPSWEITAIMRQIFKKPQPERKAIVFENSASIRRSADL